MCQALFKGFHVPYLILSLQSPYEVKDQLGIALKCQCSCNRDLKNLGFLQEKMTGKVLAQGLRTIIRNSFIRSNFYFQDHYMILDDHWCLHICFLATDGGKEKSSLGDFSKIQNATVKAILVHEGGWDIYFFSYAI